jgi:uncharacterized protein (TIGR00255 family)
MIKSMTGYGAAERSTSSYHLKVEIKTLNSKFLDAILKLPREFAAWEMEIKSLLETGLHRGKVNFSMEFELKSLEAPPVEINEQLFKSYFRKYKQMAQDVSADTGELFKLALNSPNVIRPMENPETLIQWEEVSVAVREAMAGCNDYRANEGGKLQDALVKHIEGIGMGLQQVLDLEEERNANMRQRLKQAMSEIQEKVKMDENRFEQELIYYLEKLDIQEEKDRLKAHLSYFHQILEEEGPHGKKLGFLTQEIGREINTMGAKANHYGIQRSVVSMKEDLEKIKEQLLNVI